MRRADETMLTLQVAAAAKRELLERGAIRIARPTTKAPAQETTPLDDQRPAADALPAK